MKINCGRTPQQRDADRQQRRIHLRQWRPWFAWHPVRIGPGDCRWLETIERREEYGWLTSYWVYRLPG